MPQLLGEETRNRHSEDRADRATAEEQGVGRIPASMQYRAPMGQRSRGSDTVPVAAGITLAFLVVAWFASQAINILSAYAASALHLRGEAIILPMQWAHFLAAVVFALAIGVTVGKVAPRSAMVGIIIGSAISFVLGTMVSLWAMTRVQSLPANFLALTVFWSLVGTVTFTITEIVIARWVGKKHLQAS